jgi:hypothetical protein
VTFPPVSSTTTGLIDNIHLYNNEFMIVFVWVENNRD